MNKSNLYPILTYKEFYGAKFNGDDPLSEIARFDFEDVMLALILIFNDISQRIDKAYNINETFVRRLPPVKAARLKQYILQHRDEGFLLTSAPVIAKIITGLFRILPQAGEVLPGADPSFEETLLDLILIYNEKQFPDHGLGPEINTHTDLWKLMLMQDITGLTHIHFARTSNIKHLVFIQFLKHTLGTGFTELENNFKARTGVNMLYDLALNLITLYVAIENKFKEPGNAMVLIDKDEFFFTFLKTFDLVFNKTSVIGKTADLGFYVTHPFFEHSNGKIYLVDQTQFAFALDRGWFHFLFSKSDIKNRINGVHTFGDFQGYLGKHYFERYLITGLFKTINRPGFRVIETEDKNLPDITAILNEKDIFFIEIKSSALHYKVIDEKEIDLFKKFIDDNFASEKKGANQLFTNIRYFGKSTLNEFQLRTPKSKVTIYPVIIYTEQHLEKHAVNDYVNEKFSDLLSTYTSPFREIKPLVMIHYDFFVENISLLDNRPSLFKKAINAYIDHCKKKRAVYIRSKRNMDYLTSMVSFDKFIVRFEKLYMLEQMSIFKNISRIFKLKQFSQRN